MIQVIYTLVYIMTKHQSVILIALCFSKERTFTMRATLIVLSALSISLPAFGQVKGDEGRYFHLKPPSYSVPSARKHAIHKKAEALRWYREHLGSPLISPESNIDGITTTK
jgi:hypothetical protein